MNEHFTRDNNRKFLFEWYCKQNRLERPSDEILYRRVKKVLQEEPDNADIYRELKDKVERLGLGQSIDDTDWPTQAATADRIGLGKMAVHRLIKKGELKDNGKSGPARRVDPASILKYCEREGVAYNDS